MSALPLQLIDNFLLQYHIGHVLTLVFGLSVVGALPLKSRQVLSANTIVFGLLFLLTPNSMMGENPFIYKYFGVILLVVGPVLYVTARR